MLTEMASARATAAALLPGIEGGHFRYSRSLHPSCRALNSEIIGDWIRDLRHQVWGCYFATALSRCHWGTHSAAGPVHFCSTVYAQKIVNSETNHDVAHDCIRKFRSDATVSLGALLVPMV